MRLYSGLSPDFITAAQHGTISAKLKESFFKHYRYWPSESEERSWDRSLRSMSRVIESAELAEHGVILEYQLPLTSRRLDCMICGKDDHDADHAVVVELKQWGDSFPADGDSLVSTWIGGAHREVLHPSAQVGQYHSYLADMHTAFWQDDPPISLSSCSFLHNYEPRIDDPLLAAKFDGLLENHPAFFARDFDSLGSFLVERLRQGDGERVLNRVEKGEYRPSKKFMQHVGEVIKGKPQYVLLDEQKVVFDSVLATVFKGASRESGTVILVRGGPGTGKSVLAINLMSELLLEGVNAQYATGSKAFTETLRSVIGRRGSAQFKYFNSFMDAEPDIVDVLICDEAHRIRANSNHRFMKAHQRSDRCQIDELLDASKVAIFLVDDRQVVRPDEVGSSELILSHAKERNYEIREYRLEAQFRCAGSEGFVNWIDNTLGIARTADVLWNAEEDFDFRIFSSPEKLDEAIRIRSQAGFSSRLTAGFCWKWSKPKADGTLEDDVVIDDYRRPWNARPDSGRLARGIPKSFLWANDPGGIDQIGCVYTAQGFEFDYAGVIIGKDLVYDWNQQQWVGRKESSRDTVVKRSKDAFIDLVKNTYRVLLSRGLKGCYVFFQDADTEKFFRSRIEGRLRTFEDLEPEETRSSVEDLPFKFLPADQVQPFENCVPVYSLQAAAGSFGPELPPPKPNEAQWAKLPAGFKPAKDLFLLQVRGESMNRRIPNGAWCLFRFLSGGSRTGKIVLAQLRDFEDVETGSQYTVKLYESKKKHDAEGGWAHTQISLNPKSTDQSFESIEVRPDDANRITILAELVAVLA